MKEKTMQSIKFLGLTLGIALSIFAISLAVYAWTAPTATPPTCPAGSPGCDAPVHVGTTTQTKVGALGVGGVFTANSAVHLAVGGGNVGIGVLAPGGLGVGRGDLIFTRGTAYGAWRYGGRISTLSRLQGRQLNNNTDFLEGLSTYFVYDNGASGSITHSIIADATAPNASGRILQIAHTNVGTPSPGWGGFHKAFGRCADVAVGQCYREGNRIIYRIWARIPVGYTIDFASNAYGTGGTHNWISSQAGTGNWEEYIAVQQIGLGGTLSTTGFWFITGGTRPFTWHVASVDIIDIDQPADVDRASELNVGYRRDVILNPGNLLTTQATFLAVDGGNVGIGTTAPGARLHVEGNIIAAAPTASNHVATRGWVEAQAGGGCPSTIEDSDRAVTTLVSAITTCRNLGGGWRLPTAEEIACFIGASGVSSSSLWTRSPNYGSDHWWVIVRLSDGNWYNNTYYNTIPFRCVR